MASNNRCIPIQQNHGGHQSGDVNQRKRARVSSDVDSGGLANVEQDGGLKNDSGEDVTFVTYEVKIAKENDSSPLKGLKMAFPRHTEKGFAKAVEAEAQSTRTLPPRKFVSEGQAPFNRLELFEGNPLIEVDKVLSTAADAQGKVYIRKVLTLQPLRDVNDAQREFKALNTPKVLSHKHIISISMTYEELGTDNRRYGIIMEPVPTGNLEDYLVQVNAAAPGSPQIQETIQKWFGCLASSLAYIHARGLSHGNISLRNVLLKGDEIMFTEFAISQHFKTRAQFVSEPVVLVQLGLYSAPEASSPLFLTKKADVFALGCIFFEMLHTLSGRSYNSFSRGRKGSTNYCQNLSRIPDLLAVIQGLLSTAFQRSIVLCTQSMLEYSPTARRSSFDVARFIFEALEREQQGGKKPAEKWLKCNCLCPWEGTGGDGQLSL